MAEKLSTQQKLALERLAPWKDPVPAELIRCRTVWYAGDVLRRLAKRGLVSFTGTGTKATYAITDAGREAMNAR